MSTLHLSIDGPHSDEYTAEVAAGMAEVVRVLNHATQSANGITYPSTVYSVTGSLRSAAFGLNQLLEQTGHQLTALLETGRVGVDTGGDPAVPIAAAQKALERARGAAADLAAALTDAQNATARLHIREA